MSEDSPTTIVVLSTADYDSSVWTNKQHLASRLAKTYDVIYVDSMGLRRPTFSTSDAARIIGRFKRKPHDRSARPQRLRVIKPRVLPFHSLRAVRWLNGILLRSQLARALSGRPYAVWTFSPLTYGVERTSETTIYHAVDLLHTFKGVPGDLLLSEERSLIRFGAHLLASSSGVMDHLLQQGATEVSLWENVADTEMFASAGEAIGFDRADRLIFAGNLTPSKIDIELLEELARTDIPIALAGPADVDGQDSGRILALIRRPNVEYLGNLTPPALAQEIASSKVGLIPYLLDDHTAGVFPMKVYEYLAAGCTVVSTALQSLRTAQLPPGVRLESRTSYVRAARDALRNWTPDQSRRNTEDARPHSWEARAEQARTLLSASLTSKRNA